VRYGKAILVVVGFVLLAAGVVALFVSTAPGVVLLVLGLLALVLGAHQWSEFEAEVKDLLRIKVKAGPSSAAEPFQRPEVKILDLVETGGNSIAVDFRVEIVNLGTEFCRAEITASVDGRRVETNPTKVDLVAGAPPQHARILVPRPALGNLVPEFSNATTLYARTLTVVAMTDRGSVQRQWKEHVYTPDENLVRYAIQRRVWAAGRGEDPSAIALPAPLPIARGAERVQTCRSCGNPTAQVLEDLVQGGDGRVIAQSWRCRECGEPS
jgi:hypothetical protein